MVNDMAITVAFDPADLCFRLYASSHGYTAPAGERLFRAPPHPRIAFTHETREEAERDADKLRAYLAALPAARKTKRKSSAVSAFEE